jgi:hypothetical protein
MKYLFLFSMLISIDSFAHPGIGIVKDSKNNLYYTDLVQVWKITNGKKTIVVPGVHTHELYLDKNDNLFGEGGYYDDRSEKFYHYLWVLHPDGIIDTVIGMREAYINMDFSFAKDRFGNEYYTKAYIKVPDSVHIFKRTPGGFETILASGNFKGVKWLNVQENGSLFFVNKNTLYEMDSSGSVRTIKKDVASQKPSFPIFKDPMLWGVWKDNTNNIYVAAFSDQAIKIISPDGTMTEVFKSPAHWTPLHGVFDNSGRLWVLETSDKNEVRVSAADIGPFQKEGFKWEYVFIVAAFIAIIALVLRKR